MTFLALAPRSCRAVGWTVGVMMISAPWLVAGSFSISGGFQWWNGHYVYQTSTTTYALTAGARFQSEQYSLALTLPILFQNSDLVSQTGGMFVPHGSAPGVQGSGGSSHRGSGMIVGSPVGVSYSSSLGDIFVTGNYRIAEESQTTPLLTLTGQVKVPTAGTAFGTGEWDYGAGLSLRKRFGTLGLFGDAGYLVIGDPAGVDYRDPFTFGVGVGNSFSDGTLSAMLYYQAYTKVLEDYAPPQQLSVGLLYQSSTSTSLSLMSSFGLSETSPGIGIGVGVNVEI